VGDFFEERSWFVEVSELAPLEEQRRCARNKIAAIRQRERPTITPSRRTSGALRASAPGGEVDSHGAGWKDLRA
jgi:hypothetical protein